MIYMAHGVNHGIGNATVELLFSFCAFGGYEVCSYFFCIVYDA